MGDTNWKSIVAIIGAFICPVIGLVFAILAKKEDPNDGLAKLAFILSLIFVILYVVIVIGCAACGGCLAAASTSYLFAL